MGRGRRGIGGSGEERQWGVQPQQRAAAGPAEKGTCFLTPAGCLLMQRPWTNPTFPSKLLYPQSLMQCQEKKQLLHKESSKSKRREPRPLAHQDTLKISPSTGNAQHHPSPPFSTPPPPPHLCSAEGTEAKRVNFNLVFKS